MCRSKKSICPNKFKSNLQENDPGAGKGSAISHGPKGGVINVDGEESLLVVRASAGSADATVGGPHLFASFAIGRFEIEDLLVGQKCSSHKYLARSFDAPLAGMHLPLVKANTLHACFLGLIVHLNSKPDEGPKMR